MYHFKDITKKDLAIIFIMYAVVFITTWVAIDIHYTSILTTIKG